MLAAALQEKSHCVVLATTRQFLLNQTAILQLGFQAALACVVFHCPVIPVEST